MPNTTSIKDNEYAALLRSEYLISFDTFCDQLKKAVLNLGVNNVDMEEKVEHVLTEDKVTDYRKKAMVLSYYKYGAVLENYVRHTLMNPIGDIAIRIDKYIKTHALDYVIDICNFAMLAYWTRTTNVYKMQELDVFAVMYLDDLKSSYTSTILAYAKEYIETKDLSYLAMICCRSYMEAATPSFEDAMYKKTDDENIRIAGFSSNEIKRFKKEG